MSILEQIKKDKNLFLKAIKDSDLTFESLTNIKNQFLGRKGLIASLFLKLSKVDKSEKAKIGKKINDFKEYAQFEVDKLLSQIFEEVRTADFVDFSLPGDPKGLGSIHPLTLVLDEIKDIFTKLGFSLAYGPEAETEFYNFDALNIKDDHPARDMQDTFYIDSGVVLRTHTSNTQIHTMLDNNPPIKIIAPGRVYRNEDISVRSYCLFHQIEGLYVDKKVSFADLKGVLNFFAKEFFGNSVKTRFRPSYFPFTEPSAEMDIAYTKTNNVLKFGEGDEWLEILGCGMVNPIVLENCKIDSKKFQGFAFGMGIDRLAMLKYGINDLRAFFETDYRWLSHFGFDPLDVPTNYRGLSK